MLLSLPPQLLQRTCRACVRPSCGTTGAESVDGGSPLAPEWFYSGHYGELGPLTREQVDELIEGGVIGANTLVWRVGMSEWIQADRVPEFAAILRRSGVVSPPPLPGTPRPTPPNPPSMNAPTPYMPAYPRVATIQSDKSRTAGGILQLLVPGVGRMYLGHWAIGIMQLILSPCFVGVVWSWIDGVIILSGGVRLDGYGRELKD